MAVPPLQLPNYGPSQQLDFTPLSQLGELYRQGKSQAVVSNLQRRPDGSFDTSPLFASGDMNLAKLGMELERNQALEGRDKRDFAFRQSEAERAQRNTETGHGFQREGLGLQRQAQDRANLQSPYAPDPARPGGVIPTPGGSADPAAAARNAELQAEAQRKIDSAKFHATIEDKKRAAIREGLVPGTPAYQRFLFPGSAVAGDAGTKAPSGYQWKDPDDHSKGVTPIPGGPGEKVDAEVAARIGLGTSFLRQFPKIRESVAAGGATGAWDAAMAAGGQGRAGEVKRQIDSGADALTRLLTGAGMNLYEATDYADRYRLGKFDTADKMTSKLDQLKVEIETIMEVVGKGRGGFTPPNAAPVATPPPATITPPPAATSAPISVFDWLRGGK